MLSAAPCFLRRKHFSHILWGLLLFSFLQVLDMSLAGFGCLPGLATLFVYRQVIEKSLRSFEAYKLPPAAWIAWILDVSIPTQSFWVQHFQHVTPAASLGCYRKRRWCPDRSRGDSELVNVPRAVMCPCVSTDLSPPPRQQPYIPLPLSLPLILSASSTW